ncbi:MAG: SDR family oxidoreductase [Parasporobacterium sp.]|nr:SDR family oxidoreductase [Parasporobacterium sp.]
MSKFDDLFSLKGKKAMVIGGGGGIGRAIAHGFSAFGADVCIASRNLAGLQEVAAEIEADTGNKVRCFTVDVADEQSIIDLVSKTKEEVGTIDILVNSQGYNKKYSTIDCPIEEWDKIYAVNIRGVMICCREFGKGMIEQNYGRVINIGSIGAKRHSVSGVSGAYSSSKGAVASFTTQLAAEWAKYNITVNGVCPILTLTKMMEPIKAKDPEHFAKIESRVPMGRIGLPEDTVGMSIFFASEASKFVTGQFLYPDGGLMLLQ